MLVVRLRSGARGVNGDLPEGVEVLGIVGLALLELDDGNAVTAVVDVSTEHGIVDHLEEGGLVEILTVESVRAVAQQLADLLLSLLVEEEHVRALLGELGILGIGEPVGVVLADADVSNVVAELPADLIVGIEELDGAVLDGEHPGSERSGVVVRQMASSLVKQVYAPPSPVLMLVPPHSTPMESMGGVHTPETTTAEGTMTATTSFATAMGRIFMAGGFGLG